MLFGKAKVIEVLQDMDPERIYVENVRELLDVREAKAEKICEHGERYGFFEKWISYEHPTEGYILAEHKADSKPPKEPILDPHAELLMQDKAEYMLSELRPAVFYRVRE